MNRWCCGRTRLGGQLKCGSLEKEELAPSAGRLEDLLAEVLLS